jgi:hypothetical protein
MKRIFLTPTVAMLVAADAGVHGSSIGSGRAPPRRWDLSVLLDLPEHGPMCHHAKRAGWETEHLPDVGRGPAPLAPNTTGAGRQNKIYLTYPKADCIPVSAKRNL